MKVFSVSAAKREELIARMRRLGISENDLKETFVLSSGPGGQKVNKTSTCVCLKHMPTGISVRCQQERSQALNRFFARRRLLDRIEKIRNGFIEEEERRIEKIRRQKRRRSRRAKEKILANKHRQAEKKQLRSPVRVEDDE